jgi:hypothetical protein
LREVKHRAVIIHIDSDLFASLGMQHRESGTHRDGIIALTSRAKESAYDALLGIRAAEIVVEDGEESSRVDGDGVGPTESPC